MPSFTKVSGKVTDCSEAADAKAQSPISVMERHGERSTDCKPVP